MEPLSLFRRKCNIIVAPALAATDGQVIEKTVSVGYTHFKQLVAKGRRAVIAPEVLVLTLACAEDELQHPIKVDGALAQVAVKARPFVEIRVLATVELNQHGFDDVAELFVDDLPRRRIYTSMEANVCDVVAKNGAITHLLEE